jgi:hypothetical protein
MMKMLSEIEATLVQVRTEQRGRPATVLLAPDLTREQHACVEALALARWMPILLSSSMESASQPDRRPAA